MNVRDIESLKVVWVDLREAPGVGIPDIIERHMAAGWDSYLCEQVSKRDAVLILQGR